jgi:hypothetical protein
VWHPVRPSAASTTMAIGSKSRPGTVRTSFIDAPHPTPVVPTDLAGPWCVLGEEPCRQGAHRQHSDELGGGLEARRERRRRRAALA